MNQSGSTIPRKRAVIILIVATWLSWLTGTFTGTGLGELMSGGYGDCGAADSGCWWSWFRGPAYDDLARLLRTVGFFGISLMIQSYNLRVRDRTLLQIALGLSVLGDLFLVGVPGLATILGPNAPVWFSKSFLIGVGVFLVAHLVLIRRHMEGHKASISTPDAGRVWRWNAALGLVVGVCMGGVVASTWSLLRQLNTLMFVVFLVYIVVLAIGVWAGVTAWLRPALNSRVAPPYIPLNSLLIGVGMVCFGVTDVALGLEYLGRRFADDGGCWQIITVIKDLVYSPALMFLTFSGFTWVSKGERLLKDA